MGRRSTTLAEVGRLAGGGVMPAAKTIELSNHNETGRAFFLEPRGRLCGAPEQEPLQRGAGARSGPGRENLLRRHHLLRRTGEIVSEFSGAVGDMDLDGVQAAILHPQAELFINFLDTVLLQAIAHASASVRAAHIAMQYARYFGRCRAFDRRPRRECFQQRPGPALRQTRPDEYFCPHRTISVTIKWTRPAVTAENCSKWRQLSLARHLLKNIHWDGSIYCSIYMQLLNSSPGRRITLPAGAFSFTFDQLNLDRFPGRSRL